MKELLIIFALLLTVTSVINGSAILAAEINDGHEAECFYEQCLAFYMNICKEIFRHCFVPQTDEEKQDLLGYFSPTENTSVAFIATAFETCQTLNLVDQNNCESFFEFFILKGYYINDISEYCYMYEKVCGFRNPDMILPSSIEKQLHIQNLNFNDCALDVKNSTDLIVEDSIALAKAFKFQDVNIYKNQSNYRHVHAFGKLYRSINERVVQFNVTDKLKEVITFESLLLTHCIGEVKYSSLLVWVPKTFELLATNLREIVSPEYNPLRLGSEILASTNLAKFIQGDKPLWPIRDMINIISACYPSRENLYKQIVEIINLAASLDFTMEDLQQFSIKTINMCSLTDEPRYLGDESDNLLTLGLILWKSMVDKYKNTKREYFPNVVKAQSLSVRFLCEAVHVNSPVTSTNP